MIPLLASPSPFALDENETDERDYDFVKFVRDGGINSTRLYMLLMYALIRSNNFKRVLEVGTYIGRTTAVLAQAVAMTGGHLWTVDVNTDLLKKALIRLDDLNLTKYVNFWAGKSWVLAGREVFDFVFVDGDHGRLAVEQDWATWSSRVVLGGMMAFHDATGEPDIVSWANDTFPRNGWEHFLSPGDAGLLLLRKTDD